MVVTPSLGFYGSTHRLFHNDAGISLSGGEYGEAYLPVSILRRASENNEKSKAKYAEQGLALGMPFPPKSFNASAVKELSIEANRELTAKFHYKESQGDFISMCASAGKFTAKPGQLIEITQHIQAIPTSSGKQKTYCILEAKQFLKTTEGNWVAAPFDVRPVAISPSRL
ncbi:hypothetical protein DBR37_05820 [Herminiimonas sp. KBW02]|nr:hypothetical protein DBR37_05820 [Herminiimonas sp. KBW02]